MNQPGNVVNRMVRPGISEEPDVPSEDNRTFEDGRLFPAGVSSQVRHYETVTTTTPQGLESGITMQRPILEAPLGSTPIREAETYAQASTTTSVQHSLSHVDPITRKDADAVLENLPRGGIQQPLIPQQTMQTSVPGQQIYTSTVIPQSQPGQQIYTSTVIPQSQMLQSGSTIQGQSILSPTAPISHKDEKAIQKNLPLAGTPLPGTAVIGTVPQQTVMQGAIPQQSVVTSTMQQQPLVQSTTTTSPEGNIQHTEIVREAVTTTTVTQPGQEVLAAGAIQTNRIENLNDINVVESQFMRDSGRIRGTHSPSYQSRYEAQQFELSTMRHENHQSFENWEANRNRFVNDRLNIMTDLLAGLDRTIDWLDVGVAKVILFFKEREAQELEYSKRVKHGLTQVGDHFQNAEHPEVLGNFSRGLKENDAFHAQEKQNCEIMGMFIKKDIIDWILTPCEKNYKEQAHALKVPLHSYKKKLDHLSSKRNKAYNKYFKTYDGIQKTGKPPKNEDSIFKRQLKYSLSAREELRMLRIYNEQGMNVINEFARLESARINEVQRAYTMYLQKYRELYQNTATAPEPILSLIETSHGPESVPTLFTVKNLLQPHNYEFVRKTLGMPMDVSYEALNPFLINFPDSVDPTRSSFVLKEWEAVKEGNLLKKPKACSVIATTNNNLLIIEKKNEEQELGKVRDPMQLRFTRVEDVTATEDGTVLKVVERAPGTLFNHTTRTKLKFETPDEAQQFMQFVNTQTSGDV